VDRSGEGAVRSATYMTFRAAILGAKQITCIYDGRYRELCPHIIGSKDGEEKVLAYQFGGESTTHLPPGGNWRCLYLADVREARIREGDWHTSPYHRSTQSCIDVVDLDINIHVRQSRYR
jgi:hypothetical protein